MKLRFTCPVDYCERDYVVIATPSDNNWHIETPDACFCGRVITAADRHALAETATQNRIEGLQDERDARENHMYERSVGK